MVSELFIVFDQIFQVVRQDNDLKTAKVGSSKFFSSHTGKADLFPHFRDVSFLGSFEGSGILLKLNQNLC